MQTASSPEDNIYKFIGGKIPKISYLLNEGLIKIKKNQDDSINFEDYTDLIFNFTREDNVVKITCKQTKETHTVILPK
jgi:hypothetical protein